MIKSLKKAFTIIELVIVIAVIAILAAVMIPTYSSLVKKANQSADIQAVKQMNTILALDEVDSNKTIADVHLALSTEGLNSKNFTPLVSDTYFYWIEKENRIVYVDSEKKVIYPEDLKDKIDLNATEGDEKYRYYCSLNGVIEYGKYTNINGEVEISSAEQLYSLSKSVPTNLTKIKFTESEIDAHGADISFDFGDSYSDKTIIIEGAADGTTIKNVVTLEKHKEINNNDLTEGTRSYGSGFIAFVGKKVSLEISNIFIEGGIFGNLETGGVGALIGRIDDDSHDNTGSFVKINNCKVEEAIINGRNKTGALIGSIGGNKKVEVKECKVSGCTVNCSEGASSKAIGSLYGAVEITIDNEFSKWVENTTLNLVEASGRDIVDGGCLEITKGGASFNESRCEYVVQKCDDGELAPSSYRMFDSNACMIAEIYGTNNKMKININTAQYICNEKHDFSATLNGNKIDITVLKFFE